MSSATTSTVAAPVQPELLQTIGAVSSCCLRGSESRCSCSHCHCWPGAPAEPKQGVGAQQLRGAFPPVAQPALKPTAESIVLTQVSGEELLEVCSAPLRSTVPAQLWVALTVLAWAPRSTLALQASGQF